MNKLKTTVYVMGIAYAVMVLFCLFKPAEEYSVSERRRLAQRPAFSAEALVSGKYMEQAESYVTDQFPFRDGLRCFKAAFATGIMRKQDTNEVYEKNGYLCAMEYPMDEESITRAAGVFQGIYDKYLKDTEAQAYFSVIPDKNYFLAGDSHLSMDYEAFLKSMYGKTEFLTPIPIEDKLQITDYYKTDSHWKQEEITDVAAFIVEKMKAAPVLTLENPMDEKGTSEETESKYTVVKMEKPFYGVYYGQAALPAKPDELRYCTNEILEQCVVYDYENNREIPLYDEEKSQGRDPYEMFLGGNISLVTITNPAAENEKELVVFGDSFSRSIVPLLAENYSKTTLYDIRYLPSAYVGNYITFTNQDVLFLYSTSVLNNSITLK